MKTLLSVCGLVLLLLLPPLPVLAQALDLEAARELSPEELLPACEDKKSPNACAVLGNRMMLGRGMDRDFDGALERLDFACQERVGWACFDIAEMVRQGQGSHFRDQDMRERVSTAFDFYNYACQNQVGDGCYAVGRLLIDHKQPDYPRHGVALFKRGCFDSRWTSAQACFGYVELFGLEETKALVAEAGPSLMDAMEVACGPGGPAEGCVEALQLCMDGVKATCGFYLDVVADMCGTGSIFACRQELNLLAVPARAGDGMAEAVAARGTGDLETVFEVVCKPSAAGNSADGLCPVAARHCEKGSLALCAGFLDFQKAACEDGKSAACWDAIRLPIEVPGLDQAYVEPAVMAVALFGASRYLDDSIALAERMVAIHGGEQGFDKLALSGDPLALEKAVWLRGVLCDGGHADSCERLTALEAKLP